jgi:hypothetical protein
MRAALESIWIPMASRTLADSSFSHIVNAPIERIDLAGWLLHLTSAEFRRCCPFAHIAAGLTTTDDRRPMWIAVETIGASLLVHHYVEEITDPHHCRMVSISDAFLPSGHVAMSVAWELSIEALDERGCEYINHLTAATGELLSLIEGDPARLESAAREYEQAFDSHNEQETPLIAESIERRALA